MSSVRPNISPARRHFIAVAGLVAVLAAGTSACGAEPEPAGPEPSAKPSASATNAEPSAHEIQQVADPETVSVPQLGISAALQPLDLGAKGQLTPPEYGIAGWYDAGPEPGESGPAVIAGHVDSKDGPDVFARLGDARRGHKIEIDLLDGKTIAYRVTEVAQFPTSEFPTSRVYGETERPELRLITCGGAYDRAAGRYQDNVVVFAELAR